MRPVGYLFSLPEGILNATSQSGATVKDLNGHSERQQIDQSLTEENHSGNALPETLERETDSEDVVPAPQCNLCSVIEALPLESVAEQRSHFKSDWHRHNLKRKLAGKPAIEESSFEALLADDRDEISSISGSDSNDDEDLSTVQRATGAGAQIVLQSAERKIAIWKVLLGPEVLTATPEMLQQRIQSLQSDSALWCILLSRGGHFAGVIFQCTKKPQKKLEHLSEASSLFTTVVHKTFHRYVVRAKAGGKQSGKDATGKFAKSAGSQIRRHNEAALKHEIAEMFKLWKAHFERVSRIFVAAPGSNELQLYDAASPILSKTDPRISKIPFITNRPTLSEAKRVLVKLLTVFEPQEDLIPQVQQTSKDPDAKPRPAKSEPQRVAVKNEQQSVPAKPQEPALHQAARLGDADLVAQLLREGHDPTVSVGKTAYAVAANKAVRDAFRRHMAAEPGRWDWAAAGVPSPLTPELEQEQQAKELEKKERQREKEKARKKQAAERKKAEKAEAASKAQAEVEAAALSAATDSKYGGGVTKKVQKTEEELRKRREVMAAAAEARMAALSLASKQQTLWSAQ